MTSMTCDDNEGSITKKLTTLIIDITIYDNDDGGISKIKKTLSYYTKYQYF